MLAVVVVDEDSPPISTVGAVRSCAWQLHPFGAVAPVAPLIVTTTVHVLAPSVNVPAAAPPVVADTEHPDVVNLVPPEMIAGKVVTAETLFVQEGAAVLLFDMSN